MQVLDVIRLNRLATDLDTSAQRVTAHRVQLKSRAELLHWQSPASRAFAAALQNLLILLATTTKRYSEAADALRAHQRGASDRLSELATVGSALEQAAETVENALDALSAWP
jgi:uncharacterized phage infection (PIP) family protein YhgE